MTQNYRPYDPDEENATLFPSDDERTEKEIRDAEQEAFLHSRIHDLESDVAKSREAKQLLDDLTTKSVELEAHKLELRRMKARQKAARDLGTASANVTVVTTRCETDMKEYHRRLALVVREIENLANIASNVGERMNSVVQDLAFCAQAEVRATAPREAGLRGSAAHASFVRRLDDAMEDALPKFSPVLSPFSRDQTLNQLVHAQVVPRMTSVFQPGKPLSQ